MNAGQVTTIGAVPKARPDMSRQDPLVLGALTCAMLLIPIVVILTSLLGLKRDKVVPISMQLTRTYNEDDAKLVRSVESAVLKKIPPYEVEEFVGCEAEVNTRLNHGILELRMTNIAGDRPELDDPPGVHLASTVVYWPRPVQSKGRKVVGITWDEFGEPTLFVGTAIPR